MRSPYGRDKRRVEEKKKKKREEKIKKKLLKNAPEVPSDGEVQPQT